MKDLRLMYSAPNTTVLPLSSALTTTAPERIR